MATDQSEWDTMDVEDVAEILYWIAGGFRAVTRWGRSLSVVKWFIWHIEDDTPATPRGVKSGDLRFGEVAQQIPPPDKWDQRGWYGRISTELNGLGFPWGVGAISTAGEVMRVTLGVPGVWRTLSGDEASSLLSDCRWTSAADLGEMCFGSAFIRAIAPDTVPSGIDAIRRRYNDDGGTGPRAA